MYLVITALDSFIFRDQMGWPIASTGQDSHVILPLEIRTLDPSSAKGSNVAHDIFGHTVRAPDYTGLYPTMFPSMGVGMPTTSLSTIWWDLALSDLLTHASATTTTTTTTSSSGTASGSGPDETSP